jgi:hypothetical protein
MAFEKHYANAHAVGWGLKVSKGGNDMIEIVFLFEEGPFEGTTSRYFGLFTDADKAAKTVEVMRTIGWDGNDFLNLGEAPQTPVRIAYELGNYNGQPQANIRFVNTRDRVSVSDGMDESRKKAFADRMKGLALASKQALATTAPTAKPKAAAKKEAKPADVDPDNIPF